MNRTLVALALAVAAGSVLADDITIDPHTFVSTRTRAEVIAEMMAARAVPTDVQADLDNRGGAMMASSLTREQVTLEYLASRDEVAATNSEDGGSAWRMARAREIIPAPVLAGLDHAAE
jgi:hypothetical protein